MTIIARNVKSDRLVKQATQGKVFQDALSTQKEDKKEAIRKYRREASRKVSLANKRLQRLERNKLTDTPAYQKLTGANGEKPRFSVKGKSHNELQKELARVNDFIQSETSTVRGSNNVLKEMANNTGIKYKNLKELKQSAGQFFELAGKIEQYFRTIEDRASAIGYQRIWTAINSYVEKEQVNLSDSKNNIEELTHKVVQAMEEYEEKERFNVSQNGVNVEGWFTLKQD